MDTSDLIFKVILWLFILIIAFFLSRKIILGHDEIFDYIFKIINKCYGYIRKRFYKESHKVDGDKRTIQDDREAYDSSSVWED